MPRPIYDDGNDRCLYYPDSREYRYRLEATYYNRACGQSFLVSLGFSAEDANEYLELLHQTLLRTFRR